MKHSVVSFATWDRLTCIQTRWSLMYSNNKVSQSLAMPPNIPFLRQKKMARHCCFFIGRRHFEVLKTKIPFTSIQHHLKPPWWLRPGIPLVALIGRQKLTKRIGIYSAWFLQKRRLLFCFVHILQPEGWISLPFTRHCPKDANTCIHEVGRTARCEEDSKAFLFQRGHFRSHSEKEKRFVSPQSKSIL